MTGAGTGFSAPVAFGGYIALLAATGLLVLWYDAPGGTGWRDRIRRGAYRLTGRSDLSWVDAPLVTAVAAAGYAACVLTIWSYGGYGCKPAGPSDLATLVASGHAFLGSGNPFTVTACGHSGNPVPAGAASVLLVALGSVAGPAGILLVWGAVSVALVPLLWELAGKDGARVTVFVLASYLYFPIVAAQVDGATLALVPVTVLLTLHLSRRGWLRAAAVGGFLATGRFPALFPVLSGSGRAAGRRGLAFAIALGTFAAVTAVTLAVYGQQFVDPVFLTQFARSHFALNYWGLLQGENWLQPSTTVTVVQSALTLLLVGVCWARARTEIGAVAIVLTGTVLLAQFLSFTELVFLVPVALVGTRARWWLWGIGLVASTNYLLAMRSLAGLGGGFRLSYGLDLLLTALLLGLLVHLVRNELGTSPRADRGPQPAVPVG